MAKARPGANLVMLNVQRLLALKGWKKATLASQAKVRPNTISNLFSRGRADLQTLHKIALAFEVDLEQLFWSDRTRVILDEYDRKQQIVEELSEGPVRVGQGPRRQAAKRT